MPDGSMTVSSFQICLASFKGKLVVITYGESEQYYQYTIWVMREYGVHESSHILFVLPFGRRVAICIGFTENGSLLICRRNDQLENKKYKFVLVTLKLYSRRILIFNMLHVQELSWRALLCLMEQTWCLINGMVACIFEVKSLEVWMKCNPCYSFSFSRGHDSTTKCLIFILSLIILLWLLYINI